jgi:hypothetical protein
MAKFTRRIEPYAGKSANWKATLIKGKKVIFCRMLSGSYETVNDALDRAQTAAMGKKTKRRKK